MQRSTPNDPTQNPLREALVAFGNLNYSPTASYIEALAAAVWTNAMKGNPQLLRVLLAAFDTAQTGWLDAVLLRMDNAEISGFLPSHHAPDPEPDYEEDPEVVNDIFYDEEVPF